MRESLINRLMKDVDECNWFITSKKIKKDHIHRYHRRLNLEEDNPYIENHYLEKYKEALLLRGINFISEWDYPDGAYISLANLRDHCYITNDIEFYNIFELLNKPALVRVDTGLDEADWVESDDYNQILIRMYCIELNGKIRIKQQLYTKEKSIEKGFSCLLDDLHCKPYNMDYSADCSIHNLNVFIPYNANGFMSKKYLDMYLNGEPNQHIEDYVLSACGAMNMLILRHKMKPFELDPNTFYKDLDRDTLKACTYYHD